MKNLFKILSLILISQATTVNAKLDKLIVKRLTGESAMGVELSKNFQSIKNLVEQAAKKSNEDRCGIWRAVRNFNCQLFDKYNTENKTASVHPYVFVLDPVLEHMLVPGCPKNTKYNQVFAHNREKGLKIENAIIDKMNAEHKKGIDTAILEYKWFNERNELKTKISYVKRIKTIDGEFLLGSGYFL